MQRGLERGCKREGLVKFAKCPAENDFFPATTPLVSFGRNVISVQKIRMQLKQGKDVYCKTNSEL